MCGFNVKIGVSLKNLPFLLSANEVNALIHVYKHKNYLLVPDVNKKTVYVALHKEGTAEDVITAYFHAVLLGITLANYNNIPLVSIFAEALVCSLLIGLDFIQCYFMVK